MTISNLPREGACRCGQVRLRINAQPLVTMACHCKGCQRMTASAFSLSVAVPADGFEVVEGQPEIGGIHGASQHFHCGYCKSWLFTRPQGMDWFVNVRTTLLDDTTGLDPLVETWTSEKLPWAATPAAHRFETLPPMDAYEGLMAEFAAR